MAIIRCKMCGGELALIENQTVAECEYCGSRQTVPTMDNEKKLTLFARASRLRAACEFDKAAGIYETIVADFPEEAEAYWGLVLCKYGIEYVDDPATGKKIPTCHRSSFESLLEDPDFEQTLENADALARRVYREEAKQIEQIRRGIIAVSANEEPYDIFICYKETDENGQRTLDSVLAQDIYDALTEKGYRTFFSRITLEDKLGQEYEPYIFAALNSAKIMLAVGTDYEYYNAVWVKNEWSRFLKLMAKDKTKYLIPCYKGIDAYDMPREFTKLQAQDLGKMGAIQDILRGVEKLLPRKVEIMKETVILQNSMEESPTEPLLRRAFLFLEDGNWSRADEYCEKVLDMAPESAAAYLGKLLAELQVHKKEDLVNCTSSFAANDHFRKALRFADPELRKQLEASSGYVAAVMETLKNSDIENGILKKYRGSQRRVVLPRSVTGIGKDAFRDCVSLRTIEIPHTVTEIASGVFTGCVNLSEILLSEKNTGFRVAGTCLMDRNQKTVLSGTSLQDIPADGSICRIGEKAFYGSGKLTEIQIPEGITHIGKEAFAGCENLRSVALPASVMSIASDAFPHNPEIRIHSGKDHPVFRTEGSCLIHKPEKTVVFGTDIRDLPKDESVTGIGENAFFGCKMPEDLEISENIKRIGANAFSGCGKITSITFLGRVLDIADNAFGWAGQNPVIYAFAGSDGARWAGKNGISPKENQEMKRISTAAFLDQGNVALKDGNWAKAGDFFKNALGNDAQNAAAYLGRALVQEQCHSLGALIRKHSEGYQHVSLQKLHLDEDTDHINEMAAKYTLPGYVDEKTIRDLYRFDLSYTSAVAGRQKQYADAVNWWENHRQLSRAEKYAAGDLAAELQQEKRSLLAQMEQRTQNARKDEAWNIHQVSTAYAAHLAKANQEAERIYQEGAALREKHYQTWQDQAKQETDPRKLKDLAENFVGLGDYENSSELAETCQNRATEEEKKLAEEKAQRRAANAVKKKARRKRARPIVALVALITAACLVLTGPIPRKNTEEAEAPEQMQSGQSTENMAAETQQTEPELSPEDKQYEEAARLEAEGQLGHAAIAFGKLGDYRDARARSFALWDKVAIRRTVAVGDYHTLALKNDGTVLATGSNVTGKNQVSGFEYHMEEEEHPCNVEDWTDIVAVAASTGASYGLKSDGTVVTTKAQSEWFEGFDHWKDIVAISDDGAYGLKMDGTLVTENDYLDFSGWSDLVAVYPVARAYPYVSVVVGLRADGTFLMTEPKQISPGWKLPDVKDWENVTAFANRTGFEYTVNMALKEDGTVVAAGTNNLGQCNVQDWADIVQIETGGEFCTLGLKSDGTVVAAGRLPAWYNPTNWTDIVAIAASGQHVVGLKPDGTLVVTGSSTHNRCDVSDWTDIKLPGALHTASGATWSDVSVFDGDPAADYQEAENLLADGEIVRAAIAFGKLDGYEDARERSFALWRQVTAGETVSAGHHTVGIREDGSVLAVGYNEFGQCNVSGWRNIVAVSAGNRHTVGLAANGSVIAVGSKDFGMCDVSDWQNIVAVSASAGSDFTVGLKDDGTVVYTGWDGAGQEHATTWEKVVAVSAGGQHVVGLLLDGTVIAEGRRFEGQCVVSDWQDIVAISAGYYNTVGLKSDGTVVVTGDNQFGQCNVSDWQDIVAVSAGFGTVVGLKSDGTVVSAGRRDMGMSDVSGWQDIVAVSARGYHRVGIKSDGSLVAAGPNNNDRCNVSDWTNIKFPQ